MQTKGILRCVNLTCVREQKLRGSGNPPLVKNSFSFISCFSFFFSCAKENVSYATRSSSENLTPALCALKKNIFETKIPIVFRSDLLFYHLTFMFLGLYCLSNCLVSVRGDVSVQ